MKIKHYIPYIIGKVSKKYRLQWWRKNNGKWLWGVIKATTDLPPKPDREQIINL